MLSTSVVGHVAIFDNAGDGGQLRSVCSAENPTDYVIPQGQWGQQHVVTQCTLDGTVDWVDIHYIINNVLFNGYPPSGQGLTEVEIPFWPLQNPQREAPVSKYRHRALCMVLNPARRKVWPRWARMTAGSGIWTQHWAPILSPVDRLTKSGRCTPCMTAPIQHRLPASTTGVFGSTTHPRRIFSTGMFKT